MITWLPVVGTDIYGFKTAATGFNPLSGIFPQRDAPAKQFHNQIIGYANAFAYWQITRNPFQQFPFTTGLQRNPQVSECPAHIFQNIYFLFH